MKLEMRKTVLEALRYHKYNLTLMPVAAPTCDVGA